MPTRPTRTNRAGLTHKQSKHTHKDLHGILLWTHRVHPSQRRTLRGSHRPLDGVPPRAVRPNGVGHTNAGRRGTSLRPCTHTGHPSLKNSTDNLAPPARSPREGGVRASRRTAPTRPRPRLHLPLMERARRAMPEIAASRDEPMTLALNATGHR